MPRAVQGLGKLQMNTLSASSCFQLSRLPKPDVFVSLVTPGVSLSPKYLNLRTFWISNILWQESCRSSTHYEENYFIICINFMTSFIPASLASGSCVERLNSPSPSIFSMPLIISWTTVMSPHVVPSSTLKNLRLFHCFRWRSYSMYLIHFIALLGSSMEL